MKAKFFFCLLLLCIKMHSFAQNELTVGDKCPDLKLTNIINYTATSASVSDFRGKILLLDFWATWCSPCIASFPKIEALRKEYAGRVEILPVTFQDKATVSSFFKKMKIAKNIDAPPSVVDDSVLQNTFKHAYIPHYVWIDKNGIICAITGLEDVTETNLQKLLAGEKLNLTVKKDEKKDLDPMKPVFSGEQQIGLQDSDLIYHSVMAKYNDALFAFTTVTENRITAVNLTIKQLYTLAYGEFKPEFITDARVRLDIQDSNEIKKYTFNNSTDVKQFDEWKWQHLYSYELIVPPGYDKDKFKIMQQDLERYFDLSGKLVQNNMKCYVLTRTSQSDKLHSMASSPQFEHNRYYFHITNQPLKALLAALVLDMQTQLPLVDETGYTGNVDMEINANLSDITSVNKALQKYDLQFIEAARPTDFIVLTQNKK